MTTSVSANATFPPQQLTFPGLPVSGNVTLTGSGPTTATLYSAAGAVLATFATSGPVTAGPFAFSGGVPYVVAHTASEITLTA